MSQLLGGVLSVLQEAGAPEWLLKHPLELPPVVADLGRGWGIGKDGPQQHSAESFGRLLNSVKGDLLAATSGQPFRHDAQLVENIRQVTEALAWGERHDTTLFVTFVELQALAGFVAAFIAPKGAPRSVRIQLLQSLSILVQNTRRETSFHYLLSGGLINNLLGGHQDLSDEEVLAYFVAFIKSLALRLDRETAALLVEHPSSRRENRGKRHLLPLFEQAVRFATHREHMVKTSARAALLSILRIDQPQVQSCAAQVVCDILVPALAQSLCGAWDGAATAFSCRDADAVDVALDAEEDVLGLVNDLLILDIAEVRRAIIQCILASSLLPRFVALDPPVAYPESNDQEISRPPPTPMLNQQTRAFTHGTGSTVEPRMPPEEVPPEPPPILFGRPRTDPRNDEDHGSSSSTPIEKSATERSSRVPCNSERGRRTSKKRWGVSCDADFSEWLPDVTAQGGQSTSVTRHRGVFEEGFLCSPRSRSVSSGGSSSPTLSVGHEEERSPLTLDGLQGDWQVQDPRKPGVVSVYANGRAIYGNNANIEGQNLIVLPMGGIGRADGWVIDPLESDLETLLWRKQGEPTLIWKRSRLQELAQPVAPAGASGNSSIERPPPSKPVRTTPPLLRRLTPTTVAPMVPQPRPVVVRSLAVFLRALASHKDCVEPVARILLCPSLSSKLVCAIHCPGPTAASLRAIFDEDAPFGRRSRTRSSRSRSSSCHSDDKVNDVEITNPFRVSLLAVLGIDASSSAPIGTCTPSEEVPLACWALREAKFAVPTGMSTAALPAPGMLVRLLGIQGGLSLEAQWAVACVIADFIGNSPRNADSRRNAMNAALETLRETGNSLLSIMNQATGDGLGLIDAFMTEWDLYSRLLPRFETSFNSGPRLLQCRSEPSTSAGASRIGSMSQIVASFLIVRYLCSQLALPTRGDGIQFPPGDGEVQVPDNFFPPVPGQKMEPCPVGLPSLDDAPLADPVAQTRTHSTGASIRPWDLPDTFENLADYEQIPFEGSSGKKLVVALHPTFLLVGPPPLRSPRDATVFKVALWQTSFVSDRGDPRTLSLHLAHPVTASLNTAGRRQNKARVFNEVQRWRFEDVASCHHTTKRLEASRLAEMRRLVAQLKLFVERSVSEAGAAATAARRGGSIDGFLVGAGLPPSWANVIRQAVGLPTLLSCMSPT